LNSRRTKPPTKTWRNPFTCCSEVNTVSAHPSIVMQATPVVPGLREWLKELRLDTLLSYFQESGFDDLESLYL